MSVTVAFGLGSNLGPSESHLRNGIAGLAASLSEYRIAPLYRSRAVSDIAQPDFLNTVVVGKTDLEADELLSVAKRLERLAGRQAGPRFGPRALDIDLLLLGDTVLSSDELRLPHPRLAERLFYLVPLADLAPELEVPPRGERVAEILAACARDQSLSRVAWTAPLPVGFASL